MAADRWMQEKAQTEAERIVGNAECATQVEFDEAHDDRNTSVLNVKAGLLRAMEEQRERDCGLVCDGCRRGMKLDGIYHWSGNTGERFPCDADAIRRGGE